MTAPAGTALIGKILRPRGLRGELKVDILTNKPAIFTTAKTVHIDGKNYTVERGSIQNGYAYVTLLGVSTVEPAEKFRGREIFVDANEIELRADEVFAHDLIGFAVLNERGERVGKITAVENYGGGDFFEIAVTGAGMAAVPNEDEFIIETNMTDKTITVTNNALDSETIL